MIVAMVVSLRHIMFECVDPYNLAHFWSAVLGRPVDAGASSCWVKLPAGGELSSLLFVHNLSGRRGGNRLFIRIGSEDGTLEGEVRRLMGLGALLISRNDRGCGMGWAVMADPEGNEFYVDSSDVEVAKAKAELMIPLLDER